MTVVYFADPDAFFERVVSFQATHAMLHRITCRIFPEILHHGRYHTRPDGFDANIDGVVPWTDAGMHNPQVHEFRKRGSRVVAGNLISKDVSRQ